MKYISKYSNFLTESIQEDQHKDYNEIDSALQELKDEGCFVMITKTYTMNNESDDTKPFKQGKIKNVQTAGYYPSYAVNINYPKNKSEYDFKYKSEYYSLLQNLRIRLDDFNVNVSGREPEISLYILDRNWKNISFDSDSVINAMFLDNPKIFIPHGSVKPTNGVVIITYPKSGIGNNKYHIQTLPDIKNQMTIKYPKLNYELVEDKANNIIFSTTIIPKGYKE